MSDTATTRARMAESRMKWESTEWTVQEGLGELTLALNEATTETTECLRIMNAPATEHEDPWTTVILLENLQTSKVFIEKRIKEVETSLGELYNEIAHGPAPIVGDETDTYKTRGYKHKEFREKLKTIKKNLNGNQDSRKRLTNTR